MLQVIRDRAQGIVVWTIVGLIAITFATFGLSSYLSGVSKSVVATVNGNEVTQVEFTRAYRNYQDSLRQMFGDRYDSRLFPEEQVKQTVIEGLVLRSLLEEFIDDANLAAPHSMVLNQLSKTKAFQDENGKFSPERYRDLLSRQGINPEGYEIDVGKQLVQEQLTRGVQHTAFITRYDFERLVGLRDQKRDIGFLSVPATSYIADAKVDEAEVKEYYESNLSRFMEQEKIRVAYLDLNIDKLAHEYEVSDAAILQSYEENIKNYTSGSGEVKARHILISVNDSAKDEEARKRIEELRGKIESGMSFDEAARKYSEDPGSAKQGGDLGFFGRGIMDKPFEEAAFSLRPGKLSNPVRSRFGYHLIQVEKIRPPKITPFAEVREQIKLDLQRQQAEQRFYENSQKLDNLAYENPESLEPAAEALGLEIEESDWIIKQGSKHVLDSPKVTAAAFSDEVLTNNRNSELLELSDTHVVVVRIKEHVAARQKPLDSVRNQIVTLLKQQKASSIAFEAAKNAQERLLKGEEPTKVAASLKNTKWKRIGFTTRAAKTGTDGVPPDVLKEAFRIPAGKAGQAAFSTIRRSNNDATVVGLFGIEQADKVGGEVIKQQRPSVTAAIGKAHYEFVTRQLREQASVSVNLPEDDF